MGKITNPESRIPSDSGREAELAEDRAGQLGAVGAELRGPIIGTRRRLEGRSFLQNLHPRRSGVSRRGILLPPGVASESKLLAQLAV